MNESLTVQEAPASYQVLLDTPYVRQGYKQTDVGVIPEDWDVATLGSCLTARPSYGINAAAVPYSDKLPVYIRITDITDDGRFSPDKLVSVDSADSGSYYLSNGDIVFARTGASVGKSYRYKESDGELVFAGFLIRVQPDINKLHPAFAEAYVTTGTYWNWVRLMSMRSGQPGINGNEYAQLPIPVPPLPEQRAIATALSDVDALLTAQDKLIAKKRDIKQAAMQQLLTGKQRLPGFTGEWEVRLLGDVVEIVSGSTPKTNTPAYWDGNIKWCTPTDITGNSGKYLSETARTISALGLANCSARLLPQGALLLCSRATIGEVKIAVGEICTNQGFKSLICGKAVNNEFIYYLLLTMKPKMVEKAIGSTFLEISKRDTALLEVLLPEVEEQIAIATILSDMDADLAALEQQRDKTRALKQGMMQELLTGRIRLV